MSWIVFSLSSIFFLSWKELHAYLFSNRENFQNNFTFHHSRKKVASSKKWNPKKKKSKKKEKMIIKFWKTYTSMWVDVSIRSSWRVKRGRRVSCVNLQDPRKGPPFFKRRRHWRIVSTYLETICYSLYTGILVLFSRNAPNLQS